MPLVDIVNHVRRELRDEPWQDFITAAVTTTAQPTLTVANTAAYETGEVLEFYEDGSGEQVWVTSITPSTTLNISRGYNSTSPATHLVNAAIRKRPRFSRVQIEGSINDVIATDLWPDLWMERQVSITPLTTTHIYSVPADYIDFIEMVQPTVAAPTELLPVRAVQQLLHVPAAQSATGKALGVRAWPRMDTAATMWYRSKYVLSDNLDPVERIIAIGAAARLLRAEATEKTDRVDADNRPQRMVYSAQFMQKQFDDAKDGYRQSNLTRPSGTVKHFIRSGYPVQLTR